MMSFFLAICCTEIIELFSKRLNSFFKNVNNTHLSDSDNCLMV